MLRRVVTEVIPVANSLREGLSLCPANVAGVTTVSSRRKHCVGIMGVPFNKGQRKPGVRNGPASLREAGLVSALLDLGLDVADYGDVAFKHDMNIVSPEGARNFDHIAPCMYEVSMKARQILSDCRLSLCLGGDHSVAIGSVDATHAMYPDVAVIWVDAHTDINTPGTSNSGNVHGMVVSRLAAELQSCWPPIRGMGWLVPRLCLRNVAYIGVRDVEMAEREFLEKYGCTAFTASDVQQLGVSEVFRRALEAIDPNNEKAIHLSFDIDGVDPLEAPSTGTPVRGGLSLREGICLMEEIHDTGRLVAMDLVEFNPTIGSPEQADLTAAAIVHLVRSALGYRQLNRSTETTRLEPVAMRSQQ